MWRRWTGLFVAIAACAAQPPWRMITPPEVDDAAAPAGVRLLVTAPVDEWSTTGTFDSHVDCEKARLQQAQQVLDEAIARAGNDAKYDVAVRRAVHARCLPPAARP